MKNIPTPTNASAPSVLAEHATAIRALGKQTVANIIEIGRRLTEAKEICGHGNWLPWLDREFGWTDRTARNFMYVCEMAGKSKLETVSDLSLPMRALYSLASPSTPEAARSEVIERARAGETLPAAEIARTIEKYKQEDATDPDWIAPSKKKRRTPEEIRAQKYRDKKITAQGAKSVFILNCDTARELAGQYDGPVDAEIIRNAEAVVSAWTKLTTRINAPVTEKAANNTNNPDVVKTAANPPTEISLGGRSGRSNC
jgi:hypothetical protein